MSYERMPGGLGTWRARWLLARHNGLLGALFYPLALAVVMPAVLVWGAVLALLDIGSARLGNRGAVPVTPGRHPELYALVEQTARRLDTPMPDRVLLTAAPTVELTVFYRQRHLLIGLPLLDCLTADELRALLGHRLALLRYRHAGLVTGLLDLWVDAVRAESYEEGAGLRRATELRTRLADLAAEVQRDADEAAVRAAGGTERAARAFALATIVSDEYADYLEHAGIPEHRWWRPVEVGISDVDEGWRQVLSHGLADSGWDADEARVLATVHPRLSVALPTLGTEPLRPTRIADPVPVAPLTERERRRLVRRLMEIPRPRHIRWFTFADSPPGWWHRRATRDADSVRADVARVLGREAADDLEVFEVVRTRPRDVLAAAMDVPVHELSADPRDYETDQPPEALVWLIETNLLRRGWRLAHPAVRGVLIGPDGTRVDAREVITRIERAAVPAGNADPTATKLLRSWLTPTGTQG
ncbi:M48 family metallopeptidase [Micromonospora sp. NPDC049891]|uniref:M48 family metallopeptidase n=1 Tax=Micromonospora sp. NPDC049891 TaxID=3155655 RepID=UPI0033D0EFB9